MKKILLCAVSTLLCLAAGAGIAYYCTPYLHISPGHDSWTTVDFFVDPAESSWNSQVTPPRYLKRIDWPRKIYSVHSSRKDLAINHIGYGELAGNSYELYVDFIEKAPDSPDFTTDLHQHDYRLPEECVSYADKITLQIFYNDSTMGLRSEAASTLRSVLSDWGIQRKRSDAPGFYLQKVFYQDKDSNDVPMLWLLEKALQDNLIQLQFEPDVVLQRMTDADTVYEYLTAGRYFSPEIRASLSNPELYSPDVFSKIDIKSVRRITVDLTHRQLLLSYRLPYVRVVADDSYSYTNDITLVCTLTNGAFADISEFYHLLQEYRAKEKHDCTVFAAGYTLAPAAGFWMLFLLYILWSKARKARTAKASAQAASSVKPADKTQGKYAEAFSKVDAMYKPHTGQDRLSLFIQQMQAEASQDVSAAQSDKSEQFEPAELSAMLLKVLEQELKMTVPDAVRAQFEKDITTASSHGSDKATIAAVLARYRQLLEALKDSEADRDGKSGRD